jgi:rRNA-processing protein FCF1
MYAFVDTNLLLHYPLPDQVDWCACTGAKEAAVVIAPVVFRELNKHKDKPESRRLRDRAATVLKWFDAFIDDPTRRLREGVNLLMLAHDPSLDFAKYGLSRDLNDDWLLASILEFRIENPASNIVLVTEDRGLRVKAIAQGLPVVRLPEHLRLPDELDPVEKKLRETEDELRRLRNAMPNLRLVFEDDSDRIKVALRLPPKITPEQLAGKMTEVKQKHSKMGELTAVGGLLALSVGVPTPGDYNKQIEEFYTDYEKYLIQLSEFEVRKQTTIILEIELSNTGGAPARDVHVFMHFPDGLDVYDEDGFETAMAEPTEPKAPLERLQAAIQTMKSWPTPPLFVPPRMPSIHSIHSNVTGWSIKRSDTYDVRGHVKELTHGLEVGFGILFVVFESRDAVKSFGIDYELLAANLPEKLSGKLHVIVDS